MANNGVGSRSPLPSFPNGKSAGRPTVYCDAIAEKICDELTDGQSLTEICAADHMPERRTVVGWLYDQKPEHEAFVLAYRRAREAQSELYYDDMVPISDDLVAKDNAEVRKADLRIRTRQWALERLQRGIYGPRVDHHVTGNVSVKINLGGRPGDNARVIDHAENGEAEAAQLPEAETGPSSD